MKSCVLIFAKTSHQKTPYDLWLKDSGLTPLILVAQEFADSYSHLPNVYSFSNYDHNMKVQQKALDLARHENVVAVFARAEADIIRAAQLRERIGIPGQQVNSAQAYRNKVTMKDYLATSGVRLPKYKAVSSAYDVLEFIENHGYPVVIKPTSESGSYGTQILRGLEDLNRYLESGSTTHMEIETFVEGQMFHVDGLFQNGRIVFIQPSRYINDCLSFRDDEYCGSVTVSPKDTVHDLLVETTRLIIQNLPSPENMAFHCELWQRTNGEIVFCEIASRTGGAVVSTIIEKTFGINLDKEWFLAECGLSAQVPRIRYRAGGGVWIPPQKGVLRQLPENKKPNWIVDSQINGKIGQTYHGGVKSGLFLAGYVVHGSDEKNVIQNVQNTVSWFNENSVWEK
jgi:hypothetical protein